MLFLDGARAAIEELMKSIRDLIVVGQDARTYVETLRKLWIKYSFSSTRSTVPKIAAKVVKDLYHDRYLRSIVG